MPDLPIIAPTLPQGFCPTTWQELINEGVGKAVAQFSGSGFTVLINQEAVPAVSDRDKLWRRPSQASRGLYEFSGGTWVVIHPEPASGSVRRWWEGTEASLWAYDGGDGTNPSINPPATNNGAMWEVDHAYDGRSPMGAGTIPTANPAKILAVGENYGEGAHSQTEQEVGPHTHPLAADADITNADGSIDVVTTGAGGPGLSKGLTAPPVTSLSVNQNLYTTVQQAMPVIHPVRGGYWIKRTARVNYVGS